jgi:hypothetical protein
MEEELTQASVWCLTDVKGDHQTYIRLHDRAMLLFAMSMAVCGESLRILCWLDMFMSEILMDDVCAGLEIPVSPISLTFCATQ